MSCLRMPLLTIDWIACGIRRSNTTMPSRAACESKSQRRATGSAQIAAKSRRRFSERIGTGRYTTPAAAYAVWRAATPASQEEHDGDGQRRDRSRDHDRREDEIRERGAHRVSPIVALTTTGHRGRSAPERAGQE